MVLGGTPDYAVIGWLQATTKMLMRAWSYLEGGRPPPNRPKKLPFYHVEGSTGGTSLAAMPSVLDTKTR